MQTIEAYYDGRAFVPVTPVAVQINERAVVTIFRDSKDKRTRCESDKAYLSYAGVLSEENFGEITEILKDTGIIDIDEW